MLSTFIGYPQMGEYPDSLVKTLLGVCEALDEVGVSSHCMLFDGDIPPDPESIRFHTFSTIENCDFLFVVQVDKQRSEEMLIEVGFCLGGNVPVVVASKAGLKNTCLPKIADLLITWETLDELKEKIKSTNFSELVANH